MTTTIVARTRYSAAELHAPRRQSGYTDSGNPSIARTEEPHPPTDFRPLNLSEIRAAIPEPFSSSSLPPSLASGRSAVAFTARARVGDAGPSFCPAGHASPELLALLRERGHPRQPGPHTHKRIAVVGAGIAGLSAAWALSGRAHVTLFESGAQPGGHTHTVDVTLDGPRGPVTHGVDTGFLVFNERTYPLLIQLFAQLGVGVARSDMSFSAQIAGDGVEWSGSNLATVFAQRSNLLRPSFWGMLADLLRFNRLCTALAARGEEAALSEPIGDFLDRHRFGRAFRAWYLPPMVACIWSCSTRQMMDFPIDTLIRFCHNHGLLQVVGQPPWYSVRGGSRQYVQRLLAGLGELRLGCAVQQLHPGAHGVAVRSAAGLEHCDAVVLATHSDQALRLLGDAASPLQREVLGAIRYQPNRAVLHTDTRLRPERRALQGAS